MLEYKRSLFVPADATSLIKRVQALPTSAKRLWGTMNVVEMFVHSRMALELYMGEFSLPSVTHWYTPIAKWHALSILDFPRGIPLPYELPKIQGAVLEDERLSLIQAIERFSSLKSDHPIPAHPMLGSFTRDQAGRFAHKHTNHHLKQFGG
jgi:hypothetical protein